MSWAAPSQVLKQKTHCVRGHAYSETGFYRKDDGYRRCAECRRQDAKAHYWRERSEAA